MEGRSSPRRPIIDSSAASLGTRFLPATKAMPKEMPPLADKPLIQYVAEHAAQSPALRSYVSGPEGPGAGGSPGRLAENLCSDSNDRPGGTSEPASASGLATRRALGTPESGED